MDIDIDIAVKGDCVVELEVVGGYGGHVIIVVVVVAVVVVIVASLTM